VPCLRSWKGWPLYYEREDELRKKVSEALMYPTIISVVSVAMVLVLLFVVLPMLVSNFASFGVQTPPITMAVLNARDWMVERWYVVLAIIIALMLAYRYWVRTKPGRYIRDSILLKLPVLGELQKMVIFSRFCRTLALLLNSGIAMLPTLQILERLMDNAVIKRAVQGATRGVERGEGISPSLGEFKAFPNMLVQMVSVGEETGNLETVLVQLADYYDREVNFSIASFTKLLEPVIMLVLAVVVLFILLSVYLPMMQMVIVRYLGGWGMAKKALGLDLDFSTIRAVEVARKGRNKVVTKLAERDATFLVPFPMENWSTLGSLCAVWMPW
jgi:type IV pilus assembly protein PilC